MGGGDNEAEMRIQIWEKVLKMENKNGDNSAADGVVGVITFTIRCIIPKYNRLSEHNIEATSSWGGFWYYSAGKAWT